MPTSGMMRHTRWYTMSAARGGRLSPIIRLQTTIFFIRCFCGLYTYFAKRKPSFAYQAFSGRPARWLWCMPGQKHLTDEVAAVLANTLAWADPKLFDPCYGIAWVWPVNLSDGSGLLARIDSQLGNVDTVPISVVPTFIICCGQ
jgi:hypothetical protein